MKVLSAILVLAFIPHLNSFSLLPPTLHPTSILNFLKSRTDDIIEITGGNTQCASDLRSLVHDLIFREKWALQMIDASAKVPSGILSGNYHLVGSFDECINIREVKEDHVIDGQYCTVTLLPSTEFMSDFSFILDSVAFTNYMGINVSYHVADVLKMIKVTYGVCIPKSCSMKNLQKIWDYVEHTFAIPVHVHFFDIMCRYRDKPVEPYDVDKYVYTALGIYIFILLASTWYDLMIHQHLEGKQSKQGSYWIAFSLYTNTKKLFSCNNNFTGDSRLDCISGIKVISMLWIIFGHRMMFNVFSGNINSIYVFQWKQHIENTLIIGAFLAVDTFFLLSGFLLSYIYLKYKNTAQTGKGISLIAFYGFRFLRLSPALLATILFYISGFKRLSDGPAWPAVSKKFAASCRHTWWATLFFATNFIRLEYQCVEQSWFLAVDTQLYMIAPIILFNLEKRPWRTCLACLGACVVSAIYAFIITINNNYAAFFFEGNRDYQRYIYTPTFVRMPPWLIGIVLGYILFRYQQVRIPQGANLFLWISSLGLMAYLILVHLVLTRDDYDAFSAAVYNSCVRPLWALALALIIFSCITGHGGAIAKFLSLPIFQVGVRLSYSMYLVHIAVLMYFIGSRRNPDHFSNIKGVHDFMGDLFFVVVVAIIWCLAFESPFMAITKILINRVKGNELVSRKKKNKKDQEVCVYSGSRDKELKKMK